MFVGVGGFPSMMVLACAYFLPFSEGGGGGSQRWAMKEHHSRAGGMCYSHNLIKLLYMLHVGNSLFDQGTFHIDDKW